MELRVGVSARRASGLLPWRCPNRTRYGMLAEHGRCSSGPRAKESWSLCMATTEDGWAGERVLHEGIHEGGRTCQLGLPIDELGWTSCFLVRYWMYVYIYRYIYII